MAPWTWRRPLPGKGIIDNFMITVIALGALIATSVLAVACFPLPTIPERALAFLNYCLAQIVLLSIFLSETFGISTKSLLIAQFVVMALLVLIWIHKGKPKVFCPTQFVQKFQGPNQKVNWLIAGLAAAAAILLAMNVDFYRALPSMNKDALSYHLPRAYYWLQQGSLHYLPVNDFRWTEFPPNSSVILMWMMAVGVGYEWMHLPQIVGAVLIALGVYRLTILCGGNRLAAASASVICLGFPAAIYQMGTSGNDLLVGGFAVSCAAFLAGTLQPQANKALINRSAALTGISLGLGLGTKITVLLFLPGFAVIGLALFFILGGKALWQRSWRLLVAVVLGFAALGSYSYVQNYYDHGSPMLSKASDELLSAMPAELYAPVRNVVLAFYQALSWHGLQSEAEQFWPTLQRETIWALDQKVSLGIGKLSGFNDDNNLTDLSTDENRAGFGLLGFLILSVAPIIGLIQISRFVRLREYKILLSGGLVILGLSSLVLFCGNAPWGPTQVRYCVQFIPLLVPPAFGLCWGPRWLRAACHVGCALFALWVMIYCVTLETNRRSDLAAIAQGKGSLDSLFEGRWLPQRDVIRASVPTGSVIGYTGKIDSWAFLLPRELPSYRYVLLKPGEINSALMSGKVAAVITELPVTNVTQVLPVPGALLSPKPSLYVTNPALVLADNLAAYGLELNSEGNSLVMSARAIETFSHIHQLYPENLEYLKIFLPLSPLRTNNNEVFQVEIPLVPPFPTDLITGVTCNSHDVSFLIKDGTLTFLLNPGVMIEGASVQVCIIQFKRQTLCMLESDRKTLNAVYFGEPWVISTAPEY